MIFRNEADWIVLYADDHETEIGRVKLPVGGKKYREIADCIRAGEHHGKNES